MSLFLNYSNQVRSHLADAAQYIIEQGQTAAGYRLVDRFYELCDTIADNPDSRKEI